MAGRRAGGDIRESFEALGAAGRLGDLPDGPLLARAVLGGEVAARAAFAALVERHGPMVLRVCRAELRDAHAAEDAFQATFLVLARRAGAIRRADSVASWLHGVALKVAARSRADAARRAAHERRAGESRPAHPEPAAADLAEPFPELHAALARLPARYRDPLILCYFEGLTTDEAAGRLGCARGTVLSRLARGRDRLRARLSRGAPVPVVAPALEAHLAATPARVAPALTEVTARSAGRTLAGASPAGLVAPAVAQLTAGTLRMMTWTKLQTIGLAGLALVALALGARAGLAPLGPEPPAPPRQAPPAPAPTPAPPPQPARAAIIAPLPPRDELHRLLRRAAAEAIELARADPKAGSWALTALGEAQARAGDRAGAHDTLEAAAQGANVIENGRPSTWYFARVARVQADAGLKEDARATLWRELATLPASAADEPEQDGRTVGTLAGIAQEQARIGQAAEARATADRLLRFVAEFLISGREAGPGASGATSPSSPPPPVPAPPGAPARPDARPTLAPAVAPTLAAVGDFDGAFRWSEGLPSVGNVLGGIALTAAQCLDREAARPFVAEAAARMARLGTVEETYHGLSDLAEAQARVGAIDAARRSARSIGVGPTKVDYDMTDGQVFALFRVARVQREAGDGAGAAETLRLGFRSVQDQPKMRFADDRYGQVFLGQVQAGDLDNALRSVESVRMGRAEALAEVARLQAAAGQDSAARATFDRAIAEAVAAAPDPTRPLPGPDHPGERQQASFARAALAEVRAMAGDVAGALEVVRGIDYAPFRLSAMTKVAAARATAGDVAGALRLALEESKSSAERRIALQGLGEGVTARLATPALDPKSPR